MEESLSLTNGNDGISSGHEMDLIPQAVFQKVETLRRIESDIERLQMEKKALEMDPIYYKNAFSPQNRIPDDVLGQIFILIAEEHGWVRLPSHKRLIQLVLLRVCSRWRTVALHTSKLWNNIHVHVPHVDYIDSLTQLDKWLLRAGQSPVMLSMELAGSRSDVGAAGSIWDIVSPFKVKKIHLRLTYSQFIALQDTVLPDIEKLALSDLYIHRSFDMSRALPRLRSVAFDYCSKVLGQISLPWSQLQHVDFGCCKLSTVVDILRQVPMLRELSMRFEEEHSPGSLVGLTMPCLQTINIGCEDATLQLFTCPVLTELRLVSYRTQIQCTREIYDTVKRQYNIQGLQEMPGFPPSLPASSILKDAPLLQTVWLPESAIVDDEAITGIANGTLGRHLKELRIDASCDFDRVLGMVEARKRMVDGLLVNGCTWREMITGLKDIHITRVEESAFLGKRLVYKKRICTLKEAGITISLPYEYRGYMKY